MTESLTIRTRDADETAFAGELLGGLVGPGDVIALTGTLGAGKTVLVQGLARGLGVVGHVPSPTFNILLVHRGRLPLYHLDLYRLETADELVDIDFYETVESGGVAAVEWSDRFPTELPDDRLDVSIASDGETGRALEVIGRGPRSCELAIRWADAWRDRSGVSR